MASSALRVRDLGLPHPRRAPRRFYSTAEIHTHAPPCLRPALSRPATLHTQRASSRRTSVQAAVSAVLGLFYAHPQPRVPHVLLRTRDAHAHAHAHTHTHTHTRTRQRQLHARALEADRDLLPLLLLRAERSRTCALPYRRSRRFLTPYFHEYDRSTIETMVARVSCRGL